MRRRAQLPWVAVGATMLMAVAGCDKLTVASAEAPRDTFGGAALDSLDDGAPPHVLYQVFGERSDPRMVPVAALVDGAIRPLALSPADWRRYDDLYHRRGTLFTIYQDGREAGSARVTTSMWGRGEPLYTLPGCVNPTPLAAVEVRLPPPVGYLVERLASDAKLTSAAEARPRLTRRTVDRLGAARRVGEEVARSAGLEPSSLQELDFRATNVATGASDAPTLVISYIDPGAANGDAASANYLFILADYVGDRYVPTYTRLVGGTDTSSEYRRYVDHLDLTGDGVDELVLEGWSGGHESYVLILQFKDGRWDEVFRGRQSWCNDIPRRGR